MKTLKTNILAVITTLLLPLFAAAAPNLINYQGRLVDNNGNPMSGTKTVVFRICDSLAASCASPLWTDSYSVTLENGIFSVKLGSGATPLTSSVYSADDRYLEIVVDAVTLSPRVQLVSVPFALAASNITSANNVSISTGVIVSGHVQAVKFYGDGSALTGISTSDSTKVAKTGDTMTGRLTAPDITLTYGIGASTAVFSGAVTAASFSGNIGTSASGVTISTYATVNGHVTAVKYYGDGSSLSGIAATSIGNDAVGSAQIIDGSIATADIGASQVADSNIIGMSASKLTGAMSYPASANYGGGMQISTNVYVVGFSSASRYYGDGSSLTGISASVISDNAVTTAKIADGNVTLPKIANIATARILGNNSGSSGAPSELDATTVKTMLALNNVDNVSLNSWAGSSNITTVGTVGTGVWNATAISVGKGGTGLTTIAADNLIYASALNTYAAAPITAFGRSLIDDANAGAALTTLGAAAASDVAVKVSSALASGKIFVGSAIGEAAGVAMSGDATISNTGAVTLATVGVGKGGTGLTTIAADNLVYSSALDTYAATPITAFGRSLIDDANAAAALTTLGAAAAADVTVKVSSALASGKIFVGSAIGEAAGVAMSGDATISNTGAVTLATVGVGKGGTGLTTIAADNL
ncbi:MAG: hypothetical protein ACYC2I_04015, partial [Elusimicrobiales bacterium]